jgi:methylase of polypeptide subunit release factors
MKAIHDIETLITKVIHESTSNTINSNVLDNPLKNANVLQEQCQKYISFSNQFFVQEDLQDDSYVEHCDSFEILIEIGRKIASSLESYLEIVYSYDEDEEDGDHDTSYNIIKALLCDLANIYKLIALMTEILYVRNNGDNDGSIIASEAYLDFAIASKKAQNDIQICVGAHLKRMELCSKYKISDAIRLLGLSSVAAQDPGEENVMIVEEMCNHGIFQAELYTNKECADKEHTKSIDLWYPSENAIDLGKKARETLIVSNYTLENVTEILVQIMRHKNNHSALNHDYQDRVRFFSSNSFFNHRHDILTTSMNGDCLDEELFDQLPGTDSCKILAFLFLFGLALKRERIRSTIGDDQLQSLFDSRLIRISPCCEYDIIAEYQIYPLHTNCFDAFRDETAYPLYFMTDWPIESLRLPRDAIMAVGYDTLELISLSSGTELFNAHDGTNARVLDLCCGCGIQGIFAAGRSRHDAMPKHQDSDWSVELICADINERAKHFVIGNVCLNLLSRGKDSGTSCYIEIFFLHGDVYKPIVGLGKNVNLPTNIGRFDHILSNPPFVAVPKAKGPVSLSPALYSAGGGIDGMNLLRQILIDCFNVLKHHSAASLLMVTELPNVEDSCELISSFLDIEVSQYTRIRIAYIKDDVESVDEYTKERENEAGLVVRSRDWSSSFFGIRNRALVLLSICKDRGDTYCHLGCYDVPMNKNVLDDSIDEADSEDAFLTQEGIHYTRKFIL